jgi:hypothetical protein
MSLHPATRGGLAGLLVLAITLALTGCGRTLVFAEQTGFNLSIIAKSSEATPLNVNIGLDRKVASLVPPIHEKTSQSEADGEGVNMFAGFKAAYDPGIGANQSAQPFAGDLRIRTQFASGQAAKAIAGNPSAVLQVVNVSGEPLFIAAVVDDSTQKRKVAINQYVRGLAVRNDKATLDAIADKLNLPQDPEVLKERNIIIIEMDKRVRDKASMDALSTLLRPITNKDF